MGRSSQISGEDRVLRVNPSEAGERLDRWLPSRGVGSSRAQVQRWIEDGHVLVNGRAARKRTLVQPGDRVEVRAPERPAATGAEDLALDVVFEDEEILVVNKPPHMIVHPVRPTDRGTLVHALQAHTRSLSSVGGPDRPGIVHRLDKGTSGLLVVAKTDEAHRGLAGQFKTRTVDKEYRAVVWGRMPSGRGTVSAPLGRHRWQRKKMAVRCEGGREADTHYELEEGLPLTSLVRLKPGSGRTHQLRVHLAYLGHPIFGDPQYGGRRIPSGVSAGDRRSLTEILRVFQRQALHAAALAFDHPAERRRCRFRSPLPGDMEELIARLGELAGSAETHDRGDLS